MAENLCRECKRRFVRFHDLRKHVKKCHGEKLDDLAPLPVKTYGFSCPECNKNFNHKNNFNMHRRKMHTPSDDNHSSNNQLQIENVSMKCPLCNFVGKFKKDLYCHYRTQHDIDIKVDEVSLSSRDEFEAWLTQIEKDTETKFIKKKVTTSKTVYVCHRSGWFRPRGDGKRRLKIQGSKKINGFCPAGIEMYINEGTFNVRFVKTHVGHETQSCHLYLSDEERKMIASKIAMKIPFNAILEDVREALTDSSSKRIQLLTKKELHNIEASFNRHSTSQSGDSWMKEMKNESLEIVEMQPKVLFNFVSTSKNSQSLEEEKKTLHEKAIREINNIQTEAQLAAVKTIINSIQPTLTALQSSENVKLPLSSNQAHNQSQRRSYTRKAPRKKILKQDEL